MTQCNSFLLEFIQHQGLRHKLDKEKEGGEGGRNTVPELGGVCVCVSFIVVMIMIMIMIMAMTMGRSTYAQHSHRKPKSKPTWKMSVT